MFVTLAIISENNKTSNTSVKHKLEAKKIQNIFFGKYWFKNGISDKLIFIQKPFTEHLLYSTVFGPETRAQKGLVMHKAEYRVW